MSTCALGGPGGSKSSVTTLVLSALSFVVTQRSNARSTKVLLGLIQSLFCKNFQPSFKWLNNVSLTPWRPALINWRHNPERPKPKSANLHVRVNISTLVFVFHQWIHMIWLLFISLLNCLLKQCNFIHSFMFYHGKFLLYNNK